MISQIEFQVSNAAAGEPIDLTPGNTIVRYSDKNQVKNMTTTSDFTAINIAAFGDSGSLLEMGEIFEIKLINLQTRLTTHLAPGTEFTIEVVPPRGAVEKKQDALEGSFGRGNEQVTSNHRAGSSDVQVSK